MSIEGFLAEQKQNQPRRFKDVVGKLLSGKEQEDTRPWKWEEEINDVDHNLAIKKLHELLEKHDTPEYLRLAKYLSSFGIIEEELLTEKIKNYLEDYVKREEKETTLHSAEFRVICFMCADAKSLDPHFDPLSQHPTLLKRIIDYYSGDHESFEIYSKLHCIDPSLKLPFDSTYYKRFYNSLVDYPQESQASSILRTSPFIRLISPSHYLPTTHEQWMNFNKFLTEQKDFHQWGAVNQFFYYAYNMRLLAAHKIEMTSKGLVITDVPPPQLDVGVPPRPMRKKI